ncbi:beta-galactosidase, partial [Streptomyces sp. G44]|uniref:beta-galactosidase small subunit n=1 Tax=Streptomyces sp. G44 TaxID=2807632 RepID=UPI001EF94FA8
ETAAWAARGHVVAWAQLPDEDGAREPWPTGGAAPVREGGRILLGPAVFDTRGNLLSLDGREIRGLRLDVWRAPTDNDNGMPWRPEAPPAAQWRALGLHRMRHRVDAVEPGGDALTVRTRVAPAASDLGLRVAYRWQSDGSRLLLSLDVEPEGAWTVPLPRLGIRFGLPGAAGPVRWFGGGPGEAYPDTAAASLVGVWEADLDALHTPYVRPQENGARPGLRWAEVGGLRIDCADGPWFTARRWTTEQLDAARHRTDLTPGDTVWVNLDIGQHGIGSGSCGPGVLPRHQLRAAPGRLRVAFSTAAPRGDGAARH